MTAYSNNDQYVKGVGFSSTDLPFISVFAMNYIALTAFEGVEGNPSARVVLTVDQAELLIKQLRKAVRAVKAEASK